MLVESPKDIKVGKIYTISYKGGRNYNRDPIHIFITKIDDRGPNEYMFFSHYHLKDPDKIRVIDMHNLFQNYTIEEVG